MRGRTPSSAPRQPRTGAGATAAEADAAGTGSAAAEVQGAGGVRAPVQLQLRQRPLEVERRLLPHDLLHPDLLHGHSVLRHLQRQNRQRRHGEPPSPVERLFVNLHPPLRLQSP